MKNFLEMKARGDIILFSDILKEIPFDDVLLELFPNRCDPSKQAVTHRGLEVLQLRLEGCKQPEIAQRLNLSRGQVAYHSTMTKNGLYDNIPPYIDVDIPALRKLLRMNIDAPTKYARLSELLQAMPSDEELIGLYLAQGNLLGDGSKRPPTNQDLQLLQMRLQKYSYDKIGEQFNITSAEASKQIKDTLMRLSRYLNINLDVPEFHNQKRQSALGQSSCPPTEPPQNVCAEASLVDGSQDEKLMVQEEKIIYTKRFPKIDLDNLDMSLSQQGNPDLKGDIQKPGKSFATIYNRMVANSVYVIKPERIKNKQRFIDSAIALSTDFEIDMDIKEQFHFVSVTLYLYCATCVGTMKSMIARLVSECDRISSFTSKTDPCDFIISLDYYTHDHYVFDRRVDY